MMNENYTKDQTEIDIMQLFWAICRKWRTVLCWMLALGVAAGAFRVVVSALSLRDKNEDFAQEQAAYEELVENNRQEQSDVSRRMSEISKEIAEQKEYEKNSVYMSLDPNNVAVAEQIYCVKSSSQAQAETANRESDYTDAIVNAYISIIMNEEKLQSIAEKCDMEKYCLKELVTTENRGSGVFAVRVVARDTKEAEEILTLFDGSITAAQSQITSTIEAHEIVKIVHSSCVTADKALAKSQSEKKDAVTKLYTEYTDQNTRYKTLEEEYGKMEAPSNPKNTAVKDGLKTALIGVLLGFVIACGIVFLRVVVSDRIYSADILTQRTHLRILGAVPTDRAKLNNMNKFDRFLRGNAGFSVAENAEGVYTAAASYLAGVYPEANTVLVAGGAESSYIRTVCDALQAALPEKTFSIGSSVLSDADTIGEVCRCDITVLVEHTGTSKYSEVYGEVENIKSLKGTFAGAVVLED